MTGLSYWKPLWAYKWEVYKPQKTCGWAFIGHHPYGGYCFICEKSFDS